MLTDMFGIDSVALLFNGTSILKPSHILKYEHVFLNPFNFSASQKKSLSIS